MRPIVLFPVLVPLCFGAIYEHASQLPHQEYDFVIVGAGAGGGVVANRLTEDKNVSVLLIEAGISNEGLLKVEIPLIAPSLSGTEIDWNFTTIRQPGLANRSIEYNRGKVLGGSTSINFQIWTRGSSEDYDRFANVTGDPGWSWNSLQPYIKRIERLVPPTDHHNTTGEWTPAVHGRDGILPISLPGYPTPLEPRIFNTTSTPGSEFIFNEDMNSGSPLGFGWAQGSTEHGIRHSSAVAYLEPFLASRPNLHVLINTQVTRVLQTGRKNGLPSFHKVEFAEDAEAPRNHVTARKEIVLSAGTVGTPHILQLSGIGDQQDLSKLGIKTIVNLPSVGKNLSDHPVLRNTYSVNSNETFDNIHQSDSALNEEIVQWNETHQGPLVDLVTSSLGWLRLPSNASIFEKFPDPAAGPITPHYEILFENFAGLVPYPPTGNYMSVVTVLASPAARGFIKLNTTNPFDQPVINPNLLGTEYDQFVMRESVKAVQRFVSYKAWDGFVIGPAGGLVNATTDAEIERYCQENTGTIWHPVGTSGMSAKDASYGVVDPDLRVKGTSGLRVVDASVMPFVPAAHTQAPTYIISERGADLIKSTWSL